MSRVRDSRECLDAVNRLRAGRRKMTPQGCTFVSNTKPAGGNPIFTQGIRVIRITNGGSPWPQGIRRLL